MGVKATFPIPAPSPNMVDVHCADTVGAMFGRPSCGNGCCKLFVESGGGVVAIAAPGLDSCAGVDEASTIVSLVVVVVVVPVT